MVKVEGGTECGTGNAALGGVRDGESLKSEIRRVVKLDSTAGRRVEDREVSRYFRCLEAWNVVDWRKVSVLSFSNALYLEPKFLRVLLLVFDYARSAEPLELLSHSHSTMLNGLSIASVLGSS